MSVCLFQQLRFKLVELDVVGCLHTEDRTAEDQELLTIEIAEYVISPSGSIQNRHTIAMTTPLTKLAIARLPCRRVISMWDIFGIVIYSAARFLIYTPNMKCSRGIPPQPNGT